MTVARDYRDPLEAALSAQVSDKTLMEHVRTIGALERESGSPGEAQAFDYIERMLKSYGIEVERREIEAFISLPLEGRLHLPDGGTIEGLTHAFSTSVVVPPTMRARTPPARSRSSTASPPPAAPGPRSRRAPWGRSSSSWITSTT